LEDTLKAFVSSESLSWLMSTCDDIGRLLIEHSDDLESVMEVLSPDYSEPEMSAHDLLMLIDNFLAKSISGRDSARP